MYFTPSFHCTKPLSTRVTTQNGTKDFTYMDVHSRVPTVRAGLRSGAADLYPNHRLDVVSEMVCCPVLVIGLIRICKI